MSARALLLIFLIVASSGAGATPAGDDAPPPSARLLSAVTLGEGDVRLYRQIFAAQAKGDWGAADGLIARLDDPLLLGHVLHQRYMHPTAWRSTYPELAGWLERYADHPNADRIHALAERRRPAGAPAPQPPLAGYLGGAGQDGQELVRPRWRGDPNRPAGEGVAVQAWQEAIERLVGAGDLDGARAEIERGQGRAHADPVEVGLARWLVARSTFARGDDAGALEQAEAAAASAGQAVPEVHWTAGIAAWRLGRIEVAARHFAVLAEAASGHPNERARAAFWAARAEVRSGGPRRRATFSDLPPTSRATSTACSLAPCWVRRRCSAGRGRSFAIACATRCSATTGRGGRSRWARWGAPTSPSSRSASSRRAPSRRCWRA